MAPESLKEKKFSIKSDVWSFGVLTWEIFESGLDMCPFYKCNISYKILVCFSYFPGKPPFHKLFLQEVIDYVVICRGHLEVPLNCPILLQDNLIKCWSYDSEDRPSFHYLVKVFKELLRESFLSESLGYDSIKEHFQK